MSSVHFYRWKYSNPGRSPMITRYLYGLTVRKIRAGDVPHSVRSVSSVSTFGLLLCPTSHCSKSVLKRLYQHNRLPTNYEIIIDNPEDRHKRRDACRQKGGSELRKEGLGRSHRALILIYSLAFLCLLCSDEVLNLRVENIELYKDTKTGEDALKVTLPYRKTAQTGGMSCDHLSSTKANLAICYQLQGVPPFHLVKMPTHLRHLCPIRAYADWLSASRIEKGLLFRPISAGDEIATYAENKPLVHYFCFCFPCCAHLNNPFFYIIEPWSIYEYVQG